MDPIEIRDLDEAKRFVIQSLRLQRAIAPQAGDVRPILEWALEIASSGQPLPPVGFVADLGHALIGRDRELRSRREPTGQGGLPGGLARAYDDHVLGKLSTDASIERAGYIVRRYEGRDRGRAVAFVAQQFRDRAGFGGVLLSPAIIKNLLDTSAADLLTRGWESLQRDGLMPVLADLYGDLVLATRRVGDVLAPEDVFELEHGTALAELSQRLALRQTLALARRLTGEVAVSALRPPAGARDVPTHVLDEDTYPVGGFASLSTRGSIESLLHSQLAYMEPGAADRPDLFDIKFLRDELLYYSRDENQFLRRRRSFVFALAADLATTRFKDLELAAQRIILTLAWLVAVVRLLTERLSTDALTFHILIQSAGESQPLAQEQSLLGMLLRESIANGTVRVHNFDDWAAIEERCRRLSATSLCQLAVIAASRSDAAVDGQESAQLIVDQAHPTLEIAGEVLHGPPGGDAMEAWAESLTRLVREWLV